MGSPCIVTRTCLLSSLFGRKFNRVADLIRGCFSNLSMGKPLQNHFGFVWRWSVSRLTLLPVIKVVVFAKIWYVSAFFAWRMNYPFWFIFVETCRDRLSFSRDKRASIAVGKSEDGVIINLWVRFGGVWERPDLRGLDALAPTCGTPDVSISSIWS